MDAWTTYKALPLRMKIAVALAAPLWLPVAFVAWLDGEGE